MRKKNVWLDFEYKKIDKFLIFVVLFYDPKYLSQNINEVIDVNEGGSIKLGAFFNKEMEIIYIFWIKYQDAMLDMGPSGRYLLKIYSTFK